MKELSVQITATVQTDSTLVKLAPSVERVEETSQLVTDFRKRVAGLSTVFQLAAIFTRILSMYPEANRIRIVLLAALCFVKFGGNHEYFAECGVD